MRMHGAKPGRSKLQRMCSSVIPAVAGYELNLTVAAARGEPWIAGGGVHSG